MTLMTAMSVDFELQIYDSQRYYRNDEFFVRGGPIFVYVGGEWTISPGSLQGGHMFDMARELGGQMFYTEHRYYGSSFPTPYDRSFENIKFFLIKKKCFHLQ